MQKLEKQTNILKNRHTDNEIRHENLTLCQREVELAGNKTHA